MDKLKAKVNSPHAHVDWYFQSNLFKFKNSLVYQLLQKQTLEMLSKKYF